MEQILYTTIDRILYFADSQGMSIRTFAKSVGISHSLLGKTKALGSDKLEKILSTYPDLNPVWLLTGKGEMLEKKSEENAHPKCTPKMHTQKGDLHTQNAHPNQSDRNDNNSASHLTGDFAATDSAPVDETVYIALLEAKDRAIAAKNEIIKAKDEIIATKEAQIADLRSFVEDMRKQAAVVQANLDELREAMKAVTKATKGASAVRDAKAVAASRK